MNTSDPIHSFQEYRIPAPRTGILRGAGFFSALLIALMLLGLPTKAFPQTEGNATFRVTTTNPGHQYDPRNIIAIWVTDEAGNFIKTLKKCADRREQYLYEWIGDSNRNTVDAITSATLSNHQTHQVTWDCTNVRGQVVPDGVYQIRVELTGRNGQGPYTPLHYIEFSKGPAPVTLTPSNNQIFRNMRLVFEPVIEAPDIQVNSIAPDFLPSDSEVQIQVTASNYSATEQSFDLSLLLVSPAQTIGTVTISNLPTLESVTQTFSWDTSGLPIGPIVLQAAASEVPGEVVLSNNNLEKTVQIRTPLHDLALTGLSSPRWIASGTTANLQITILNQGDFNENARIVIFNSADDSEFGTMDNVSLAPHEEKTITFPLITSGLPADYYHISARIEPVPQETMIANNTASSHSAIAPSTQSFTWLDESATWSYNDQGIDLHASHWKDVSYPESFWPAGSAPLGYGNSNESTQLSYGDDPDHKYPTYYFRKSFIADALPTELLIDVMRDDGVVVYLNGQEVIRENMEEGQPTQYQEWANATVGGSDEETFHTFNVDPGLLELGINVIAAEVHQTSATSSDVRFDARIRGTAPNIPDRPDLAAVRIIPLGSAVAGTPLRLRATIANQGNIQAASTLQLRRQPEGDLIATRMSPTIAPGSEVETDLLWSTPSDLEGIITLQLEIAPLQDEIDSSDNVAQTTASLISPSFNSIQTPVTQQFQTVPGQCTAVASLGEFLAAGFGNSIIILNITSSESLEEICRIPVPGGAVQDFALSNSILFVAAGDAGIQAFDLSSLSSPEYLWTFETPGFCYDIEIDASTLLAASGQAGICAIDIGDPLSPSFIQASNTGGSARGLLIDNAQLILLDAENGIVRTTTGTEPAPSSKVTVLGKKLLAQTQRAYVIDEHGSLSIVDTSALPQPTLMGEAWMGAELNDLAMIGGSLFLAAGKEGVLAVDLSNVESPAISRTLSVPGSALGLADADGHIALAAGAEGLLILDQGSGATLAQYRPGGRAANAAMSADFLWIAGGANGIVRFPIAPAGYLSPADQVLDVPDARDLTVLNDSLWVLGPESDITIFPLQGDIPPLQLSADQTGIPPYTGLLRASSDVVAVCGYSTVTLLSPFQSADVIESGPPMIIPEGVLDATWSQGYLMIASGSAGLQVYQPTEGLKLQFQKRLPLPGFAGSIAIRGHYGYIACGAGGLAVVNLNDPAMPQFLTTIPVPGFCSTVNVWSTMLQVANREGEIFTFDLADSPTAPAAAGPSARSVPILSASNDGHISLLAQDSGGMLLSNHADQDQDWDGLSDEFEMAIIDALPDDSLEDFEDVRPEDDFDQDGYTNLQEALTGTSPTDASSKFGMQLAPPEPGEMTLTWPSSKGALYSLYQAPYAGAPFALVQADIPATPPVNQWSVETSAPSAVFVLTVQP